MNPFQIAELIALLHMHGPDAVLAEMTFDADMYATGGPTFPEGPVYGCQAEVILESLAYRRSSLLLHES